MAENKRYVDNGYEAIEDQSFTDTETDKTYYVDYFDEIVDLVNKQEEVIQKYKHLVKIATSLIEWNTIPQVRREWEKHLSKVGDVE